MVRPSCLTNRRVALGVPKGRTHSERRATVVQGVRLTPREPLIDAAAGMRYSIVKVRAWMYGGLSA
jgi:hypothetical protein